MEHILNLLKTMGNGLLFVMVAIFMPFIELKKKLDERVYDGFSGGFRQALGVILAAAGAAGAGHHVGWTLNHGAGYWLSAGVVSWFAVLWYLWPLCYLLLINPSYKLVELVAVKVRRLSQSYTEKVCSGLVRTLGAVLPFSGALWTRVDERKNSFALGFIGALSYLSAMVGSVLVAMSTYAHVAGMVSVAWLSLALGSAAALLAGGSVLALLWRLNADGGLRFVSMFAAVLLSQVYASQFASTISSVLALSPISAMLVANALFIALFVGYVFPLVAWVLSGGFIKYLVEKLAPLNEKAYGDRDKDYVRFVRNVIILLLSAQVVNLALGAGQTLFLSTVLLLPLVVFCAVTAYLWMHELSGEGSLLGWVSFAASVYGGWQSAAACSSTMSAGLWIGIPLGVLSALVIAFVLVPLAYLSLRFVLGALGARSIGKALEFVHEQVETRVSAVGRWLRRSYENAYGDKSSYKTWFLHVANYVFAFMVAFKGVFALGASMGLGSVMSGLGASLAAALSFVLVGKLLRKRDYGLEFVSSILGLAAAVFTGAFVVAAHWSTTAVAIIALVTWSLVFAFVFPVSYLLLRFIAQPALASWSTEILEAVHDFAWSAFVGVWNQIVAISKQLHEHVFVPFWNQVGAISRRISEIYKQLRDKFSSR